LGGLKKTKKEIIGGQGLDRRAKTKKKSNVEGPVGSRYLKHEEGGSKATPRINSGDSREGKGGRTKKGNGQGDQQDPAKQKHSSGP